MLEELQKLEKRGQTIHVGLIGAGAMGVGIAWQIGRTPGMRLSFIADIDRSAAEKARAASGQASVPILTDPDQALADQKLQLDVLVEATNTIGHAARFCIKAIERKVHVVLMNAEVDLVLGTYLQHKAKEYGVVVTSDAGDQHGVIARMIDEISLWGFDVVQAGNIKGFLDRYATAEAKREIAKQLRLSVVQCVAYTDGTKLNIEMALLANGFNLTPYTPGMQGPAAKQVTEALDLFDLDAYKGQGRVDYLLNAEPGGGVYVIGKCDDPGQAEYLKYYKVHNSGPYYLFYRPYHLCHIETPRAIARAFLWNKPILTPRHGRVADVYAYAKQPLKEGMELAHSIGGDELYGLVRETKGSDASDYVPIGVLEVQEGLARPRLRHAVKKDEPLHWDDIELADTFLLKLFREQAELNRSRA